MSEQLPPPEEMLAEQAYAGQDLQALNEQQTVEPVIEQGAEPASTEQDQAALAPGVRLNRRATAPVSTPGEPVDVSVMKHPVAVRQSGSPSSSPALQRPYERSAEHAPGDDPRVRRVARVVAQSAVAVSHESSGRETSGGGRRSIRQQRPQRPETLPQSEWGRKKPEPTEPEDIVARINKEASSYAGQGGVKFLSKDERQYISKIATEFSIRDGRYVVNGRPIDPNALMTAQRLHKKITEFEASHPNTFTERVTDTITFEVKEPKEKSGSNNAKEAKPDTLSDDDTSWKEKTKELVKELKLGDRLARLRRKTQQSLSRDSNRTPYPGTNELDPGSPILRMTGLSRAAGIFAVSEEIRDPYRYINSYETPPEDTDKS